MSGSTNMPNYIMPSDFNLRIQKQARFHCDVLLPNMSDSVPQTCLILQRNNIILPSYACLQFCPCFSVITIL